MDNKSKFLSLKVQSIIGLIIVVLLVFFIGLVASFSFRDLGRDADEIVTKNWPASIFIKQLQSVIQEHSIAQGELVEAALSKELGESEEHIEEHYKSANERLMKTMIAWNVNLAELQKTDLYKKKAKVVNVDMNTLMVLFRQLETAYRIADHEEALSLVAQSNLFLADISEDLLSLKSSINQSMNDALLDINENVNKAIWTIIILTIIVAILELTTTLLIRRMEKKQSAEITKLKNEFVFIATHELRAPVTEINWHLEEILVENKGLSNELMSRIKKIKNADNRLMALVNDLLNVAQSEAGKIKITASKQNIGNMMRSTIEELRPLTLEKNITLNYEPVRAMPLISVDSLKMKEILVNIIGNAIKYNKNNGSVTIRHELKKNLLITHIEDTGIGFSETDIKHLFERFWRAKNNETEGIEGTGLGLFIAKELVERMDGKIWIKSQKDKGSTFSFQFPTV